MKEITFRTAFVISLSMHFFVLSSGSLFHFHKTEKRNEDIEVTYVFQKEPERKEERTIENIPEKYELEKRQIKEPQGIKKTVAEKQETRVVAEEAEQYMREEEVRQIEEYIAYYDLLRERIKKQISRYGPQFTEEGEVDIVFVLTNDGRLKKLHIDDIKSTPDKQLKTFAEKSIRQAAPFPPFPSALKRRELTFSIPIIFTKEN